MSGRVARSFFERAPEVCARELLGCEIVWGRRGGIVVEAEAYSAEGDAACHTAMRPSARVFVATKRAGCAYVYFNYGMHWMLNVLTRGPVPGFVLVRAIEPTRGLAAMSRARNGAVLHALCSGPGKLAQALGVTGHDHGRDLCATRGPAFLEGAPAANILCGPRVGISSATELPWRFAIAGNPHVSKPRP